MFASFCLSAACDDLNIAEISSLWLSGPHSFTNIIRQKTNWLSGILTFSKVEDLL